MMEWLGGQLDIKNLNDWYRAPVNSIRRHLVHGIASVKILVQLLKLVYPQHKWSLEQSYNENKYVRQREALMALKSIFPHQYGKTTQYYYPAITFV